MGEISEHEIARKAAKVHNDFTLAQPTIDRHNRYRQQILAMEKRFVTNNFAFRFFTSMLGTLVVNVFMAHRYFNEPKAEFKVELDKLALALVNNVFIEPPSIPKSPATHVASPGSAACDDGEPHWLIPLRSIVHRRPQVEEGDAAPLPAVQRGHYLGLRHVHRRPARALASLPRGQHSTQGPHEGQARVPPMPLQAPPQPWVGAPLQEARVRYKAQGRKPGCC